MPPIEAVLKENTQLKDRVVSLEEEIAALKSRLEWLQKQVFAGGKSETYDRAQLLLQLQHEEGGQAPEGQKESIHDERKKPARGERIGSTENFAHLPVSQTGEIIPEEVKADPEVWERIGQEESFEVDIEPPKLVKKVIIRPKYRSKKDRLAAPLTAPAPKRFIDGSFASAGLVAWVVLSKYVDHCVPRARAGEMTSGLCATIQPMRDVAPRGRPSGAVLKSPLAAVIKIHGRERKGKRPKEIGQMSDREMNESEPSMTCRNVPIFRSKPEGCGCSGIRREAACCCPIGLRHEGGMTLS